MSIVLEDPQNHKCSSASDIKTQIFKRYSYLPNSMACSFLEPFLGPAFQDIGPGFMASIASSSVVANVLMLCFPSGFRSPAVTLADISSFEVVVLFDHARFPSFTCRILVIGRTIVPLAGSLWRASILLRRVATLGRFLLCMSIICFLVLVSGGIFSLCHDFQVLFSLVYLSKMGVFG